ncbi:MAG: polyphosphate kinase 1 [Spirochaetales bacterium]|nr:polyphosphate kinase 1 [Spirochaetales bacterium]
MRTEWFFNRELSWLEFNARVLEEGLDRSNAPLDRLRFLAIVSSNFDEFFMVRVAGLKAQLRAGDIAPDASGLSPAGQLEAVSRRAREIVGRQYDCLSREILPELAAGGLEIVRPGSWDGGVLRYLETWFAEAVLPVLTPLAVKDDEPFPSTGNLRIHAAFLLRAENGSGGGNAEPGSDSTPAEELAIVQMPQNLDRFVPVPATGAVTRIALLDDVLLAFGHALFPGRRVLERSLFKVTRDADIGVDEGRDDDFVAAMEEILINRQNSWPVRISVSGDADPLAARLAAALGLGMEDVYFMHGPIDLKGFLELAEAPGFDRLRAEPWKPLETWSPAGPEDVFARVRERDVLIHLPYESFRPVVRFIEAASDDPRVLAIKMTLYRTSGDSPIVKALTRAARSGKQVTVVVELKARFDEERNIAWAQRLEQAGAVVVYGVASLKVHAKAALVIRREDDGRLRRYAHLSTGNYNDRTARIYADLSLLTASEAVCSDLALFFNALTGLSSARNLRSIGVSPFDLKLRVIALIEREAERSHEETPGLIMAKMNSLCDEDVIRALYRASSKGVRILLNVRGICTLAPGIKGLSENIRVVSIVGRFLEHARAFLFLNGGAEEVYLSSADWMPRNLEKRIELLFPVTDPAARGRIRAILETYFRDEAKARELGPSGRWKPVKARPGGGLSAQEEFRRVERERNAAQAEPGAELTVRRKPSS